MSYVTSVGGVAVVVDTQAARPREAARPSPSASSKSPEMATRAPRPREDTGVNPKLANAYLADVQAAKGQQARLEALLKKLGAELGVVNTQISKCLKAGANCTALNAKKEQITKAASLCIEEIKKLAAKANASATAAIATGASREAALRASAAGKQPTTAIETNNATVTPNGTVVVGPDAKPADLSDQQLSPADVVVSTGTVGVGMGTLAVVGVLGFLGYRFAKKKGWV